MKFRWVRLALASSLLLGLLPMPAVRAAVNTCTVEYSPASVAPSRESFYNFEVFNSTSVSLSWVEITPPEGSGVTMTAGSAARYTAEVTPEVLTFTGGPMPRNTSQVFVVKALTGPTEGDLGNWTVNVSDRNDMGATCTGSLGLTVEPQGSDVTISNVNVVNVGSTAATVTWDTNVPTNGRVAYGKTASYGSLTPLVTELSMSHSITILGLTPGTGYHFAATSATQTEGSATTSPDGTFVTLQAPVAAKPNMASSNGGSIVTPTELVAPAVDVTTDLSKPFAQVPLISGTASDNVAVAKVEYSLDGGKNWQTVDSLVGVGASMARTTYGFRPVVSEDGDYMVTVRATDTSGNTAVSAVRRLVIDQLPPRFGTSVVMTGPQVVLPGSDGILQVSAGVDCRLNVSMIGGPVSATLRTYSGKALSQSFTLAPGAETGVWTGVLSFPKAGRYELLGEAVDGAGNRTKRVLATLVVVEPVQVSGDAKTLRDAVATLYYLNPEDHSWTAWDGATYGQENPQLLRDGRPIRLLVPPGKYYLKIALPGRPDTLTRSFELQRPTPLSGTLQVKMASFKLGSLTIPLPWTSLEAPPLEPARAGSEANAATGQRLPLVKLPTTTGRTVSPVDWYGRPTVVATMATWVPASVEQLAPLAQLQQNADVNVVIVAQQQRAQTLAAYMKIAGSSLEVVADPDGLLSDSLTTSGIPALYFLDRHGIIKKVMVGTQSAEELLTELSRL